MSAVRRVEYASQRRMRERNTAVYRAAHWPIWIFVFFLVPGPLIFDLFAGRGNRWNLLWLVVVLMGTGIAALRGRLPGSEPGPYILRFTEDRPNPLYRRVCYTFGWNAAINFALMNLLGLVIAVGMGRWYMQQIYARVYAPVLVMIVLLGSAGVLPRTHAGDVAKLIIYCAILLGVGAAAAAGLLPRTRPILPGELVIAD